MHNLFLNLVQHHMREVLQLEVSAAEEAVATAKEMVNGREVWANGNATPGQLKRLKFCVLTALCEENKISVKEGKDGKKLRKKEVIGLMIVSVPKLCDLIEFDNR